MPKLASIFVLSVLPVALAWTITPSIADVVVDTHLKGAVASYVLTTQNDFFNPPTVTTCTSGCGNFDLAIETTFLPSDLDHFYPYQTLTGGVQFEKPNLFIDLQCPAEGTFQCFATKATSNSFIGLGTIDDNTFSINTDTGKVSYLFFSDLDQTSDFEAVLSSSAVPELSTWAMMLLGFGSVGFAGYRQSRKSTAAPVLAT